MKIITLIENLTYKQGLVAEHGLSLYLETKNKKILFDTGQSGLFIENAEKLGVDIPDIDALVLSHGHYDHTGGLYPFLDRNSKAKVYAKKDIFVPKYHEHNRFIGTIYDEAKLKDRLFYISAMTEIDQDIFIMPDIPLHNLIDTHFKGLYIKQEDEFLPDEFSDELFITIKHNEQINILTACSHRGITNICKTAVEYFNLPVGLILGGFHMKEATVSQYVEMTNYFQQLQPRSVGVCHCTGIDKFADMRHDCGMDVFYNFAGSSINIH